MDLSMSPDNMTYSTAILNPLIRVEAANNKSPTVDDMFKMIEWIVNWNNWTWATDKVVDFLLVDHIIFWWQGKHHNESYDACLETTRNHKIKKNV